MMIIVQGLKSNKLSVCAVNKSPRSLEPTLSFVRKALQVSVAHDTVLSLCILNYEHGHSCHYMALYIWLVTIEMPVRRRNHTSWLWPSLCKLGRDLSNDGNAINVSLLALSIHAMFRVISLRHIRILIPL